jgi:hypothetical protein
MIIRNQPVEPPAAAIDCPEDFVTICYYLLLFDGQSVLRRLAIVSVSISGSGLLK